LSAALPERRRFVGRLPVDAVTFEEALRVICALSRGGSGGAVFTPNVDHVVMAEDHEALRGAYARAELCLADGVPVVWASRLSGDGVPEKISGADLMPRLMAEAERLGLSVYLLGGAVGVADRAARSLLARHPRLRISGVACPAVDMSESQASRVPIIEAIRAADPDLVFVCMGAPKQELFIAEARSALTRQIMLGVGAALDFEAGTASRAPAWVSAAGLEWAHRLLRDPARLWRRYLLRDPRFAAVVLRDWQHARSSS
jgi:N-acetylglucosaminyldiphosphoundecaprenol N-acetyl-beta-D-mannosaminyltransferase